MLSYGLTTTSGGLSVPLVSIGVESTIQGFIANVEHTLTYRNERDNPIEAIFTFPLDECSAIYRFEAEIEDRLIIGECQEKEEARETYQDAIAAGQSAFLLEEDTNLGDVFSCSVGNLPPKTDAVIRFAYAIELSVMPDQSVRFVLPAVLSPRYDPGTTTSSSAGTGGPALPKPSSSSVPVKKYVEGKDIPYTFSFKLYVVGDQPLHTVKAEDKKIKVKCTRDKTGKHQVELGGSYNFDRDLILFVSYDGPVGLHSAVEMGDPKGMGLLKENLVMLNFCPQLGNIPAEKGEYIFIVDRSGSMSMDNRVERAAEALKQFLQNLPQDCYFNIACFGSTYTLLFQKSQKKSVTSLAKANKLQKELAANMGGTDILPCLKAVLSCNRVPGYPQQIFLLTDGEVMNTAAVVQLVKEHTDGPKKKPVRVFTFGIGHGASTALVKGVARVGKGKAFFVTDVKQLPDIVESTLKASMQPSVTDVKLTWPNEVTAQYEDLQSLFVGDRLIVYAVVKAKKEVGKKKLTVKLSGTVGSRQMSYNLTFQLIGQSTNQAPIHRLCAKTMIKNLQDDEGNSEKHKAAIVLLSRAANIISRHTSYVGVDRERPDKVTGDMETMDVPLANLKSGKEKKKGKKRLMVGSSSHPPAMKMMRFQPHSVMFASAPNRGSQYGGGSADAPNATKYVAGKTPQLPPDFTTLTKVPNVTNTGADQEKVTTLGDATQGVNNIKPEDFNGMSSSCDPSSKKLLRQSSRNRTRFARKKKHSAPVPTEEVLYGQWRDGYYYPAQALRKLENNKCEVKFRDGVVCNINADNMIPASYLSPGDLVGLHNHKGVYHRGLLLEYDADVDAFIVAKQNGGVFMLRADQLILPKATGKRLRTHDKAAANPVRLCWYPDPISGDALCLSTADLAELNPVGWINENIVNLFIRNLVNTQLSEDEKRASHIFGPEFFPLLSRGIDAMATRASERASQLDCLARWKSDLDILKKDVLFVPIFERVHWYLIVVHLTHLPNLKEMPHSRIIRMRFTIMDSYFASERREERKLLSGFLSMMCEEAGVVAQFVEGATSASVPIQENESDCGLCMLQCIEQCFRDDLDPKPKLAWFTAAALMKKRQELAKLIMNLWEKQNV